ncbi:hypothetical protein V6Z11_D08G179600 [Gossypium hirsutum]
MVCLATVGITERRFKVPPSSLQLLLICGFLLQKKRPTAGDDESNNLG